jgi:hypothetical protein
MTLVPTTHIYTFSPSYAVHLIMNRMRLAFATPPKFLGASEGQIAYRSHVRLVRGNIVVISRVPRVRLVHAHYRMPT